MSLSRCRCWNKYKQAHKHEETSWYWRNNYCRHVTTEERRLPRTVRCTQDRGADRKTGASALPECRLSLEACAVMSKRASCVLMPQSPSSTYSAVQLSVSRTARLANTALLSPLSEVEALGFHLPWHTVRGIPHVAPSPPRLWTLALSDRF